VLLDNTPTNDKKVVGVFVLSCITSTKSKDIILNLNFGYQVTKHFFVFATILKGGSGDYEVQAAVL
jgi:hypothetical protein